MHAQRSRSVEPSPSEVQIRVAYCGICGTDLHIFHGAMDHRVHFPQVLGHEMSGVITTVGSEVEGFAAGEHVTVRPLDPCGSCPACRAGDSAGGLFFTTAPGKGLEPSSIEPANVCSSPLGDRVTGFGE